MYAHSRIKGTPRPLSALNQITLLILAFAWAPFSLLATEATESGGGDASRAQSDYFEWYPSDLQFEVDAAGRAYGSTASYILAIGGRSPAGEILDTVEILPLIPEEARAPIVTRLSQPVAFAAISAHADKVYLLGGLTEDGPTDRVVQLEVRDGELIETELAPLPEARMLAGAGVHRSSLNYFLYVLGGLPGPDAKVASDRVYELPLSAPHSEWRRMDDLPQGPRVLPMVRETYNEIVVMGGYTMDSEQRLTPSDSNWGFARMPRDGHAEPGWEKRAPLPVAMARSALTKSGQSHITVVGGDAMGGSLRQLIDGTKPVDPVNGVWAFHDPFDVWHQVGSLDVSAYGGALVPAARRTFLWIGASEVGPTEPAGSRILSYHVSTKKLAWPDWVFISIYFMIVAGIGYYFAKRQTGAASFALGNRNTKWWAAGISMMASGVSTISFMALPALAACTGMAQKGPMLFLFVGMVISAFITFPLLRRLRITSTYEYVEKRFGVGLRITGSFVSVAGQIFGRIGIVVLLPALAISTMVGLDPWISILAMGIITTIYSAAGGFEAVIWTDVLQGFLLLVGFVFIGILAFFRIDGGWDAFYAYGTDLDRFNFFLTDFDLRTSNMWYVILGYILQTLAFAADQTTAQRVFAIPMKDVRKLAFMAGIFSIFTGMLSGLVGLMLFGFFKSRPEFLNPIMENDQMVPIFIVNEIPVGVAGIILATLFAAAMSTVSTSINVCGVLVSQDFYKRLCKNVTPIKEMRIMQTVTVVSGILGTGVAIWMVNLELPTLWESFQRIMSYVSGGFGAVFILGMFTRRTHELGAIVGVLVGFVAAYYANNSQLDIHYMGLQIIIVGCACLAGYVTSLVVPWERKSLTGLTVFDQIPDPVDEDALIQKEND